MSLTQENEIGKTQVGHNEANKTGKPDEEVSVFVDDDPVLTPKNTTPREVLVAAGLDPAQRQLVKVKGKHQTPYPDPNVELKVHEGEQFITVSTGGTPVS